MDFENFNSFDSVCKISILGVGGAGNNAINCMYDANIIGCQFYALNTDAQTLSCSKVENKLILGKEISKGLGAGANPQIGKQAALSSEKEIREIVHGKDMVFIAAGMGGGTGTGAAPEVARIAKEEGCLVVGIVTRPFTFEGKTRMSNAISGIENIKQYVDTLIVISNDKLIQLIGNLPIKDSFKEADNVLKKSVQSITDLIALPALINLDFADVRTIMSKKGPAMIGFGIGKGEHRAQEAAANAISSPLLEHSIQGAKSAIISIVVGKSSTLYDINDVVDYVKDAAGEDINVVFGASINDDLDDEIQVTVIATDFEDENEQKEEFDSNFVRKPTNISEEKPSGVEETKKEELDQSEYVPSFFRKKNQ